jgi:hypothetical protein
MNIRTSNSGLGTDYSWAATDDDTFDGAEDSPTRHMIGYGLTEAEAIEDLLRLMREEAEWLEQQEEHDALVAGDML